MSIPTASKSTPQGRLAASGWSLTDLFLVRVAGLPCSVLDELHSVDSAQWARSALDSESRLHTRAARMADTLEAAVARHVDDVTVRRQLINLRRDVFNVRPPRDPQAAAEVMRRLGTADRLAIGEWLAACSAHDDLLAQGKVAVVRDTERQRATLRRVAHEPALRHGLLLASPVLDRHLPTYLDTTAAALSKRARRIERSLMDYVTRTAAKTSPFSTLTPVGLGRFVADCDALARLGSGGTPTHSVARLNVAVLTRLSSAILDSNELCQDLPVRLTTGWSLDRRRIRYLRRRQLGGIGGDDEAALDVMQEDLFFLPSDGFIAEVLAALDGEAQLHLSELVDRLGSGRPREDVRRFLNHLLRLGLLVSPALQVDINAEDPVGSFGARLRRVGQAWALQIDEGLRSVNEAVRAYPAASLPRRRELLDAIREQVTAAQATLGRPKASAPRTVLYEDAVLETATWASSPQWTEMFLPSLADVARLLPIFDINLPRRISAKGYFRARYGYGAHCDDFLAFAHMFLPDFFEPYAERLMARRAFDAEHRYIPHENWFRQDELTILDDARTAIVAHVADAYRRLPPGALELTLDVTALRAIADTLPDSLGEARSWSLFTQLATGERGAAQPLLVLNRCYPGHTLQFSRFAHCLAEAAPNDAGGLVNELRAMLSGSQPPGAVFAELKGGYEATNLNLHPPVTPYELVCPGELSLRPAAEQILVEDLSVRDDPATNRLRLHSRRLGRDVIPVYLGFLVPILLPEIQQVLLTFGGTGMAQLDLWAGVPQAQADEPVLALPRIRLGNLVVQRHSWRIHPDAIPRPGGSESDYFLAWARFRRRHGVPRRVFATTASMAERDGDRHGRAKPRYVDLEQHLSLSLLAELAAGGDRLVLTEMLPEPDQLWLHDGADRYVSELAIQISETRAAGASTISETGS